MKNRLSVLMLSCIPLVLIGYFAFEAKDDYFSIIPMILLALPAYYDVLRVNVVKGMLILFTLSAYATFIEALSILTSFPYGSFQYNDQLGFKLFDLVPWTVGFGWVPLVIGAFSLSGWICDRKLHKFLLGIFILVFSDLIIDPGAVYMKFWTWIDQGIYYSVPISNYFGWLLSAIVGGSIFYLLFTDRQINQLSFLSVFTLTLGNAFWIGVTVSSGLWIPLILGCILQIALYWMMQKRPEGS